MTMDASSAPVSPALRLWRHFASDKIALAGVLVLGALILLALCAPWLVPQNPYDLSQLDILDQTTIRLKSTLSEIEDLDYAKAVTQMNKEMLALQSAMGSFSKISGLSLFDYIN